MPIHNARKRFGQNFLIDENVTNRILRNINPKNNDKIIEIGPGLSAITDPLVNCLKKLIAIEIDRDIVSFLNKKYRNNDNIKIIEKDVLDVNFNNFGNELRIIGNLPYNISSKLLIKLMQFSDNIIDQHFMIQKEVADRIIASNNSTIYGRISVMLQSRYSIVKLFDVLPESFHPKPKVTSSFLRMIPLHKNSTRPVNQKVFELVITRAFSQRRKMLRHSLKEWANFIKWKDLCINPKDRAENLTVDQFISLSNHIENLLN